MSVPQLILWTTALAVGVPSAWRNPTAGALVLAFVFSQFGLPHTLYAYPDAFTIFVIFMKKEWLRAPTCTTADRFILASFPVSWCVYVLEADMIYFYWWWSLALIAIAQFLAAGLESASPYLRRRYAEASDQSPHGLMLAYPGGGGGG